MNGSILTIDNHLPDYDLHVASPVTFGYSQPGDHVHVQVMILGLCHQSSNCPVSECTSNKWLPSCSPSLRFHFCGAEARACSNLRWHFRQGSSGKVLTLPIIMSGLIMIYDDHTTELLLCLDSLPSGCRCFTSSVDVLCAPFCNCVYLSLLLAWWEPWVIGWRLRLWVIVYGRLLSHPFNYDVQFLLGSSPYTLYWSHAPLRTCLGFDCLYCLFWWVNCPRFASGRSPAFSYYSACGLTYAFLYNLPFSTGHSGVRRFLLYLQRVSCLLRVSCPGASVMSWNFFMSPAEGSHLHPGLRPQVNTFLWG